MRTPAGGTGRPGGPAAFLLLVLAVLTGLVAMHGLGPGGLPRPHAPAAAHTGATTTHTGAAAHTRAATTHTGASTTHAWATRTHAAQTGAAQTGSAQARPAQTGSAQARPADDCGCTRAGDPAHGGGGHAQHADPTCAASGTSGAPVLPAPAPAPGGVPAAAAAAHAAPPGSTAHGRAPPSLSELQLLRV
ncbi:DUF6153 family protein [Streptomyces sp. NPDC093801]|uniref:DUF6153 family protein n=1 Tax=Streptomyces sp. NPDC093801 TaxID=3155203 RepID=UPI00344F48AE